VTVCVVPTPGHHQRSWPIPPERGEASKALFGRDGSNSIRPEKLRVLPAGGEPRDGERHADGRIAEVVYAGPTTRFVIDLPTGTRLIALQQNDSSSSADVATMRGTGVRLAWRDEHVVNVPNQAQEPPPVPEAL
jgi:putative spermidine/putrescine transport system ATP-binding protein